jgi:regulator of CtrA degradation
MGSNVTSMPNKVDAISFGAKLAGSDSFKGLFKEGMGLLEEAAGYLDGDGRVESRLLQRADALAYASESMRLTTRLMQLASWLLLQRAVNEGEMTQKQAAAEKHKVKLVRQESAASPDAFERLPERLRSLVERSMRMQDRIIHLDGLLYAAAQARPPMAPTAISLQLQLIEQAFSRAG